MKTRKNKIDRIPSWLAAFGCPLRLLGLTRINHLINGIADISMIKLLLKNRVQLPEDLFGELFYL